MLRFRKKDRGDPEIASDILFSNFFFGRKKKGPKSLLAHWFRAGFVFWLQILLVFLKKNCV